MEAKYRQLIGLLGILFSKVQKKRKEGGGVKSIYELSELSGPSSWSLTQFPWHEATIVGLLPLSPPWRECQYIKRSPYPPSPAFCKASLTMHQYS